MMKPSIFFLLFTLIVFHLPAQDDKLVKKADKFFEDKNYYQALKVYEEALNAKKDDPYINFKIAQCYLETHQKAKALQYAFDAVKYSEKPTNEMQLALGMAYHINHRFDEAIAAYQKSDPGKTNHKKISKLVQECTNGKRYVSNPTEAKITNAGNLINTEHHEYLPAITADRMKMYFTSRRPGSTGGKVEVDGQLFEDIYSADNKGGAWDTPKNVGSPLNTEIHDAIVGLSGNGQTMFVYKGSNGGDIYLSELKGNRWTKPEPLPINTEFFETCASLSPDERTLFFVRKVMDGSRDIYICSRTVGGAWSKPRKMDVINTEYDEDAPFMHADGKTLYFSSKGHTSMGGYDIFKTTRNANGSWSAPVNLGAPINSAGNDIYFVLSADGKIGFYSSEKEGGFGKQDIYSIRMPVASEPTLAMLKGTIKDDASGKPIEATISVTDNDTKELVAKYNSNSVTGEYLITVPAGKNYGITVEKEGHLFYSENVFLTAQGYKEIRQEITLTDAKPGAKVVLKNIFFASGKSDLQPQSTAELNRLVKLMKDNPTLKVEVSGHTDNIGDPKANQTLSEQRAKAVVNYLTTNGVSTTRLVAKGYGSTQPIGTNDTEEGRQKNRRTEFLIRQ